MIFNLVIIDKKVMIKKSNSMDFGFLR